MFQILISLFGIVVVYRNLSLLEKFEVISKTKIFICFIILQLPFFLFVFFKEQFAFTLLYIGIFSITLIFYRKILMKYAIITYEKRHLRVLDHLVLLMKSGKSAQNSLKIVLASFTSWEKLIFNPCISIFEMQKNEIIDQFEVNPTYFTEIKLILRSNHQVIEQLKSFREGLKIRHNLRHKSRQVTQQIRAQATISIFIYLLLLFVSLHYFDLQKSYKILASSLFLFITGFVLIFLIGGKIKWKT